MPMKQIKNLETVLHFKKGNYVYRYVLVDRFKYGPKYHHGFNIKEGRTEAEMNALQIKDRQIRRKYIIKD
jgi:hypothetical protein